MNHNAQHYMQHYCKKQKKITIKFSWIFGCTWMRRESKSSSRQELSTFYIIGISEGRGSGSISSCFFSRVSLSKELTTLTCLSATCAVRIDGVQQTSKVRVIGQKKDCVRRERNDVLCSPQRRHIKPRATYIRRKRRQNERQYETKINSTLSSWAHLFGYIRKRCLRQK